jgi:AraC-like DNA-binding protein
MEILIESKLVLDYPTLSAFYYYCRAQDTKGQGWVVLDLKELTTWFGKSRPTVRRWIKDCLKVGFMRNVEFKHGQVWLRYVAKSLIKAHTGGCVSRTTVSLEMLKQLSRLKATAYEAALIAQQQRCLKAIERQHGGSSKVVIPKQRVRRSSNAHGCDHISAQGTHFVRASRTAIGAKQSTVATKLGRSRTTLQRHTQHVQRSAMYQRIKPEDIASRPGYYVAYTQAQVIDGYPTTTKERWYRRAPNYYHSGLVVHLEHATHVDDPYARTLRLKAQVLAAQCKADEAINELLTQRKVALREFTAQLHNNYTTKQLRLLAHAILWHFRQAHVPAIDDYQGTDLADLIADLEQAMTKDEWALVRLMARRVSNNKTPLPQGIKPGDLLVHLTSAGQTKTQHKHLEPPNHWEY